jgi:hypothetical protein
MGVIDEHMEDIEMTEQNTQNTPPRTFYEEMSIAGNQLVERLETLIKEGNIRRLILKDSNGRVLLEMPLTLGVVAGAGVAMWAFPLAVLGAAAAFLARVQLVIERYENPADAEREQAATPDQPVSTEEK